MIPPDKLNEAEFVGPFRKIASAYNKLLIFCLAIVIRPSNTISAKVTSLGTTLDFKGASGVGMSARQLRFKTEFNQYLSCVFWDGTAEGSTVLVAKPAQLRNTSRTVTQYSRAVTITAGASPYLRSVAYDTQTWPEYVWPAYVANDIIYAANVSEPIGDLGQTAGETISLVDLNIDGRKWLKELDVCYDNADRKQLVEGSEIYE